MHWLVQKSKRVVAHTHSKVWALFGGAVFALLVGLTPGAFAQNEVVVVTASRITTTGFTAPTPTTVINAIDIEEVAKPNIFDTIVQLPSLQGSVGSQSNTGNTSSGLNGLSSFNARALGTIRTLTLIDGQRIVGAYVTGTPDISQFPQLLIQRVDVVTGGASASWGSDAVGGVINFVTDKKFNGFKANIQGGMTTYGDDHQGVFQVAAGTPLFGGKGHIEVSGEFHRSDGIHGANEPGGALPNGRCCAYNAGTLTYPVTGTPAGVPQITRIVGAQPRNTSEYGLITSGPLNGYAFHADGTLSPFQFGSPCVGQTCVGGDLTNTTIKIDLDNALTRTIGYARLSYNITPDIEAYGTVSIGNVFSHNTPGSTPNSGVTVQCGNAAGGPNFYLSAAINQSCITAGVTSFRLGVSFDKFPQIQMSTTRLQRRYVLGADGTFDMFGSSWGFDAYAQHGENDTAINAHNLILLPRYNAAIDAIAGPGGSVICRNPVAAANGCVPFNIMGGATPSAEALAYVDPPMNGPYSRTNMRQEAISFVANGAPFQNWAGDVAVAFGAEYREEDYVTTGDPYGDGVTAANPNTTAYPLDPILNTAGGNNWRAGNYHRGQGNYHVVEGFVETGVPLLNNSEWGKFDLNLAGRATNYSTSGFVVTWKVGLTWDTPVDGLRLRTVQSRDVRAPNLSELFAAPITMNNFVTNRLLPASAPQVQIENRAIGNPSLKPEKAQSTEIGLVYRPPFLPGFAASVDYYRVALKDGIGSLTNQNIIDLCQLEGNTSYCANIFLGGTPGTANPSYVIVSPFNLSSTTIDGFDIEASYQFDLQDWDVPGNFVLRGLANHASKYIINPGVFGRPLNEDAGDTVPLWKVVMSQSWRNDKFSLNLTERFTSAGVVNKSGIVCQAPNCPVPTTARPTYNIDSFVTPSYFFLDIGGSYKFTDAMQGYFRISNAFDSLAGAVVGPGADTIGRTYSIGLRYTTN